MSKLLVKFSGYFVADEDDMMLTTSRDDYRCNITVKQWLNLTPKEQEGYCLVNFEKSLGNSVDDLLSYEFEIKENYYEIV